MPLFSLDREDQSRLVDLPETAMGFQVIEARIHESRASIFVAFGSTLLVPADTPSMFYEELRSAFEQSENARSRKRPVETVFESEPTVIASLYDRDVGIDERVTPLLVAQPLTLRLRTAPLQAYFRFSAFPNDRRVLPNGGFVPGTYATTYNDVAMVPSGFAAVGRYALPNPMTAKYVYIIITDTVPQVVGTTVPNFGQAGGGVEVLFPNGATAVHGQPHEIAFA